MLVLCILLAQAIAIITAVESNLQYCDANTKDCVNNADKKLIFYDVNPPEGFNLRRDVYMRFAIMSHEAKKRGKDNWELVLPPWYNLYHWKTEKRIPKPWRQYFDLKSLKKFAPVVEMYEVFSRTSKNLEIDILYVLQNYEDAFEEGAFKEKWEVLKKCNYNGHFWGYKNITAKEILCVKFQGKNSKLWELISLHPHSKTVMFSHGEIPLHDTYGTKTYWDCRKSMKFNKNLNKIARKYISDILDCSTKLCKNYISIHWRRQDFARGRGNDVPSIYGTAKQIDEILQKLPTIKKIFISTDASLFELTSLEKELAIHGHKTYTFMPNKAIIDDYGDGGIAIIDQIICSHATYFVGTHESTFTFRIQEEREILGFDSSTTFNRLCPDTGECEKMSKWTIVN